VLLAPLLLAAWASAHAGLPVVPSHDTLALQLARVGATLSALLGDARLPAREGASNLLAFLGDPRAALHAAWGATPVPLLSGLRGVTFATSLAGAVLAWRSRGTPDPSGALLRFLSLAVPLQLAVITLVNREMHHLGQVSVGLALLVALGAERVAGAFTPPRGIARALLTLVCVAPMVVAGVRQRAGTDALLDTVRTPTFMQRGQAELGALLRAHADDCPRVVVADYESFGVLEGVAPEVRVTHAWPAVARGVDRGALLRAAADAGACLLSVRPSAPMVYGWAPSGADLARVGAPAGVKAVRVAERVDAAGAWATLWRMGRAPPSPARQGPEGRP
jgi:hypothetical protein